MIGAGSVQAMITSLKNNKRKRETIFKGIEAAKHNKHGLYHKNISEEELLKIKAKIHKDFIRERRKLTIIYILISIVILIGVTFLILFLNDNVDLNRFYTF